MSDWGKGVNNDIGWGQGANNDIGWGSIYDKSYAGETLLGGGGFEGMLDLFPNGSFAASPRKLKANYLGDSTTVRRANSDQLSIGFANNELNQPALVTFADGGDASNVIFRDQTGNSRDFIQSTALSQPTIVEAGSVILANTKPTLDYTLTSTHLRCSASSFITPIDKLQVSVVAKSNNQSPSNETLFAQYLTTGDKRSWLLRVFSGKIQISFGNPTTGIRQGVWISDNNFTYSNLKAIGFTFDAGTVKIYVNGLEVDSSLASGSIPATIFDADAEATIGSFLINNSPSTPWNGQISELYAADNLKDSIVGIQQNQMTYFNIS